MIMSTTEDESELKELVIQTLETSGVLPQIRAQLRASVFLALEEATAPNTQTSKKAVGNADLREYLSTPKGQKTAHLIRDFFQFFNMKSTLSVFDSESSFGQLYDDDSKQALLNELDVADAKNNLLDVLLERTRNNSACPSGEKATLSGGTLYGGEANPLKSRKLDPIGSTHSSSAPQILDRDPFFDDDDDGVPVSNSWAADPFSKSKLTPMLEKDRLSIGGNEESIRSSAARLPGNTVLNKEMDFTTDNRSVPSGKGPTILPPQQEPLADLKIPSKNGASKATLHENEYYDEDFQSSVSFQSNQKTENDQSSEGEIEESLSEIGDDLSDVHSQEQDSTVDISVSQLGGKADYTENVK